MASKYSEYGKSMHNASDAEEIKGGMMNVSVRLRIIQKQDT